MQSFSVWECDSTQRHLIIPNIVQHLLLRHLPLSSSDIYVSAGQLDYTLMEGKKGLFAFKCSIVSVLGLFPSVLLRFCFFGLFIADSSASVPNLLQAFDVLSKRIRGLEDLPLKISTIQPLHAGKSDLCKILDC